LPFVLLVAVDLQLTSAAEAASIAPAAMPVFAGIMGERGHLDNLEQRSLVTLRAGA